VGADNREAIRRAIWLARHNAARLLFFSALNLSDRAMHMLVDEDPSRLTQTVETAARTSLAELVSEAQREGIEAEAKLVRGKGWLEIIRQVLRDRHDLVVVGARHVHGLRRILFGSTASNLVRQCPCAVWVTRAAPASEPLRVLVASDFSPVADEALRLGLSLKEWEGAEVYVVHAVEYPLDNVWSMGLSNATSTAYHQKVQAEARQALQGQLRRIAGDTPPAGVHLELADRNGVADYAILQFIRDHHIDVLVIGTIARSGLSGLVIGNTAERLLPEVPCSVLTVKPPDFQCPVGHAPPASTEQVPQRGW